MQQITTELDLLRQRRSALLDLRKAKAFYRDQAVAAFTVEMLGLELRVLDLEIEHLSMQIAARQEEN